ncbi:MAG: carotenoid 1,2-hydratase [Chromatiaceae bacterium]|nr:carotenoid 1,2-hydratase [Chromatiaceae bacterium]
MMRKTIVVVLMMWLAACSGPDRETPVDDAIALRSRMATAPDPGFERATTPRPFTFPRDHGPHPTFATEWWYLTGNLVADDGHRFGYQLTLFRIGLKPGQSVDDSGWRTHQVYMGHLAVSDIDAGRQHSAERLSRAAVGLAGAQAQPLRVWLGAWSISGGTETFPLQVEAGHDDIGIRLRIGRGDRPLVLQGDHGLSRKGDAAGNASYYYSLTRLPSDGRIQIGGNTYRVAGQSWLDREWSTSALAPDQAGWDWFALQLDDGRDLMFYRMRGRDGLAQPFSSGTLVAADGHATPLSLADVDARPLRYWQAHDGVRYPVEWQVKVAAQGLDLRVSAAFDAQEMRHTVRYWEGAVTVTGSQRGVGYLELAGYAD